MVKKIIITILILFSATTLYLNYELYFSPAYVSVGDTQINQGVVFQLNYLKTRMHAGAATEMQQLYPEGYVFLNALYALSWIELAEELLPNEDLYREAIIEVNWSIDNLESDEAKEVFYETKDLPYGVFYAGWFNYILAKKISLQTFSATDSAEQILFKSNCQQIAEALEKSQSPFLESYPGACWPADMVVAMASLAIGNEIFDGAYENTISAWLKRIESKTDTIGLIPHSSFVTGEVKEGARGSSQSLILNFLYEIDSIYAKKKFEIYKNNFLDYRFGLPGIREYPKEVRGAGDIDSGPVLLGIGAAATIVGQRTMKLFEENEVAVGLRNSIETFGVSLTLNEKKRYLFGNLPMVDAFITWSNAIEANKMDITKSNKNWRLKFQLLSFLITFLCGTGIYFLFKNNNR